jgi:hypothetical protein
MSPKPCWRRIAFPDSGKVVTGLGGCARIRASPRRPACRIARHCHGENTRRTRPDLAARQSALMVLCYLPFGTTWLPSRHRHFAWTPSDQPLPTRHGPYPNPAGHRGQDVLPAETNAGQRPQGSDAMPQTAAVRRRLPTTAPRRGQTGGGPRRPLGGGSKCPARPAETPHADSSDKSLPGPTSSPHTTEGTPQLLTQRGAV